MTQQSQTADTTARAEQLATRLQAVRQRIHDAGGADLLPITKFHPVEDIALLRSFGIHAVGENREQEARDKKATLGDTMDIHMVGQIQTKKANAIARWASAVHTLDSAKLLAALDRGAGLARERGDRDSALPVLLQWSADGDPARGGALATDLDSLADAVTAADNLELRGLMVVPPLGADAAEVFREGRRLADSLADRCVGEVVYSAGMSGDLEIAIAEGATLVRVGSDIMGPRPVQ